MVLDGLLDDNCFRETRLKALVVDRHCCSVQQALFSISEPVLRGIQVPVIVSVLLLSGGEVAVGLSVHFGNICFLFLVSANGIEHLLCVLTANCGHSESELIRLGLTRPFVTPLITQTQRLLHLGSVLPLLDIVKLISKASHVLGLNNVVDVLRGIGFLAESVVVANIGLVINEAWVNLLNSRLVLETFPVFSDVFGGARGLAVVVKFRLNTSLGALPAQSNYFASRSDIGDWVLPRTDSRHIIF